MPHRSDRSRTVVPAENTHCAKNIRAEAGNSAETHITYKSSRDNVRAANTGCAKACRMFHKLLRCHYDFIKMLI